MASFPYVTASADTEHDNTPAEAAVANPTIETKPSQEPHVNPPSDCRPKVFPGTSKLSTTVSDSKSEGTKTTKVKLSFDCDENFECELLEEDEEAAITQRQKGCSKNPGHKYFYPIKEFSLDHLPEAYRKPAFVKGIKSVADLTVRLGVSYTSTDRPKSDVFFALRGKNAKRTGSGFVCTGLSRTNIIIKGWEFPEYFMCGPEVDVGLNDDSFNKGKLDEVIDFIGKHVGQFLKATPGKSEALWQALFTSHDRINALTKTVHGVFGETYEYFFASLMTLIFEGFISQDALSSPTQTNSGQELRLDAETCHTIVENQAKNCRNPLVVVGNDEEDFRIDTFFTLIGGYDFLTEIQNLHPYEKFTERIELIFRKIQDNLSASVNPMLMQNAALEIMRKYLEEIFTILQDILGNLDSHLDTNQDSKGKDEEGEEGEKEEEEEKEEGKKGEEEENEEEKKEKEEDDDVNDGSDDDDNDKADDREEEETLRPAYIVKKPCPCRECKATNSPQEKGYLITVMTARHVVFDKEEAENTVVDFFYDDATKEGMRRLHVIDIDVYSNAGDFVTLMCATHDRYLIMEVNKMFIEMSENVKKMKLKSDKPLAVICSHPHGNFKHVTVGQWTTRYKHQKFNYFMRSLYTSYLYETPTCPGSSGAPVLILGYKDGTYALDSPLHPHHGRADNPGLNSSTRLFSDKTDMKELSPKAKQRALKDRQEHEIKMQEKGKTLKKEVTHFLSVIRKQVMHMPARRHSWREDFSNRLSCMVKKNDLNGVSSLKKELLLLKRDVSAASTVPDQHAQPTSRPLLERRDSIPLD